MRFLYYDRIVEIKKGCRIVGVKGFSLSEEYLRGHFGRRAVIPAPILLESMAQVLGWGIIHAHEFKLSAILSLVQGFRVCGAPLRPGFTAIITGEILATNRRDSLGRAWMTVDGQMLAELDRIIFAHFQPVPVETLRERFCYYSGLTPTQTQLEVFPHER